MTADHRLIGQRVTALTDADRRVRVYVTAVGTDDDRGTEVWGYRWNTRTREFATTSYPRRYYVPKAAG